MGIPMDDIHTPSVYSGPTSSNSTNGASREDLSLDQLMKEKARLESELKALGSVLESHGVNMNTGLTTFDGYPRADIDVAQIRTIRAKIIPLRNDYKLVMSRLEAAVHAQFAQGASQPSGAQVTPLAVSSSRAEAQGDTAFASVNSVVPNSPAADAGLLAGDKISRFGTATWLNHDKLAKVAQIVSENEGKQIAVVVLRGDQTLQLTLTPQSNWGGRGKLGCHLVPV